MSPDDERDGASVNGDERVKVRLDPAVRTEIYEHVFSSPDAEVAGVLVGPPRDDGPVVIEGRIEARDADNQVASVTFTHESWASIYEQLEREFTGLGIVGWYHSHPGFGIFLSDHDLFIHQNFFPGERQVAYVVDPLSAREGFFGWEDGEIEKLFEQPTARDPTTRGGPPTGDGPGAVTGSRGARTLVGVAALILVGAILGVGAGLLLTSGSSSDTIASLKRQNLLLQGKPGPPPPIPPVAPPPVAPTQIYTVKSGDSLSTISTRFYGSSKYALALASANGIADENAIAAGQKLRIPPKTAMEALIKEPAK